MEVECKRDLIQFKCKCCGEHTFSGTVYCNAGIQSFVCDKCEEENKGNSVSRLNEYEMLIYLQDKLNEFFCSKGC